MALILKINHILVCDYENDFIITCGQHATALNNEMLFSISMIFKCFYVLMLIIQITGKVFLQYSYGKRKKGNLHISQAMLFFINFMLIFIMVVLIINQRSIFVRKEVKTKTFYAFYAFYAKNIRYAFVIAVRPLL